MFSFENELIIRKCLVCSMQLLAKPELFPLGWPSISAAMQPVETQLSGKIAADTLNALDIWDGLSQQPHFEMKFKKITLSQLSKIVIITNN